MSALGFLYNTVPGRICLKALTRPGLSAAAGRFLDSGASRVLIKPFVRSNGIDLSQYESEGFTCFNDCFCRKIKEGLRPVDMSPEALISPCDGALSAYEIRDGAVIPVKQSSYTVASLLGGDGIYRRFHGGLCLVFRLCVDNYHRYCYVDSGVKGGNIRIPGVLNTVRPVALESRPVFVQNSREYTVTETESFGTLVQMEVGALLVGRIVNHQGPGPVTRGEEKGMFLYGGSTVIVLLEPGRAVLDGDYLKNTKNGAETPVLYGQRIGTATGR